MTKKEFDEYLFRLFSADPSINATNIAEDLYISLRTRFLEKLFKNMEQKREQENIKNKEVQK